MSDWRLLNIALFDIIYLHSSQHTVSASAGLHSFYFFKKSFGQFFAFAFGLALQIFACGVVFTKRFLWSIHKTRKGQTPICNSHLLQSGADGWWVMLPMSQNRCNGWVLLHFALCCTWQNTRQRWLFDSLGPEAAKPLPPLPLSGAASPSTSGRLSRAH